MTERIRPSARLYATAFLSLVSLIATSVSALGGEAPGLARRLQIIRDHVDSPGYATRVSWEEHVVLAWQLGRGRTPTPDEYHLVTAIERQQGLGRSAVLSAAIAGSEPTPTADQIRRFLGRVGVEHFRVTPAIARDARRLASTPARPPLAEPWIQESSRGESPKMVPSTEGDVAYNTYFGYIHAHTGLSDGVGTPDDAFTQARAAGLDFLGVTDHGEPMGTLPGGRWNTLKNSADAHDDPGSFVALAGFEWSHPTQGHLNVMNTSDFTHAFATLTLQQFAQWLLARPGAFATFNHPGEYDKLGTEFFHLPMVPLQFVVPLAGIEVWNRSGDFDVYYYQCIWSSCESTYFDDANRKRWFLGALGGQDNHDDSWGIGNPLRTAVLATELTRPALIEAYKERRFYATEDSDLVLDVRADGFPIGSRVSNASRTFNVSACDNSGDEFEEARFYRDGVLLEARPVSGNCFDTSFDDSGTAGFHYYHVIVRQTDDTNFDGRNDEAISSPIWTLP